MLTINYLNCYTEPGSVCLIFIHWIHSKQMVSRISGHGQLEQSRKENVKPLMSLCWIILQALFSKVAFHFGNSFFLLLFLSSLRVLGSFCIGHHTFKFNNSFCKEECLTHINERNLTLVNQHKYFLEILILYSREFNLKTQYMVVNGYQPSSYRLVQWYYKAQKQMLPRV